MSKKNNLMTRRNGHQREIEREKEAAEKRALEKQKKEQKLAAKGAVKKKRVKGIRIRKGVTVKGIKISDSESKRKALRLLQAEQLKGMDLDGAVKKKSRKVAAGVASHPALPNKDKKRVKLAVKGAVKKAAKPEAPAAMET